MTKTKGIATAVVLMIAETMVFTGPSSVAASPSRDDCAPITRSRPSVSRVFQALGPTYVRRAFPEDREDPSQNEGGPDAIGEEAILLVMTNQDRPVKLLAGVEGTDLLIHKLLIYHPSGRRDAQGENLRLLEGDRLDLDRVTVNPPAAEADLRWGRDGTTFRLEPSGGARLKVVIAVPVIAHYMNPQAQRGSRRVQDEFWPKTLRRLFQPLGRDGDINTIWAQAGILFYLHSLEGCGYSLGAFGVREGSRASGRMPYPEEDCQHLFRRINTVYNLPEVPGLDLYIWWEIDKAKGYGARHRKDGPSPGPGAVWIDSLCPYHGCPELIAHEVGHFLLGCHICVTDAYTPPAERGRCGFCPTTIPECSTVHEDLLMRDDARGIWLTADEIQRAREEARRRVRSR